MSSEPPEAPATSAPPPDNKDERMWATLCHLSAFACYIGVPFGHILGPLVVWLIKKGELPLVDDQGKEALNFQISVTIYLLACIPLAFVLIGIFMAVALGIFQIVVTIIGAVKASTGIAYRYPLCIRFLK